MDLVADIAGQGPAVVLLHGQPGTAADWNAVAPMLAARFTVIVPDRLGWGRTGGSAGGFADNADAVRRLLARLDVGPAVIVGHSWAGGVALSLAEAGGPAAGLVLAASVRPGSPATAFDRVLAHRPLGDLAARLAFSTVFHLVGFQPVQRRLERRLKVPERLALDGLARGRHGEPPWRSFATEQRALLAELPDLAGGLAAVAVPVTVLNGTADRVVSVTDGRRLADELPGARWVPVANAGHLLPHDHPDEVAAAVEDVARRAGLI